MKYLTVEAAAKRAQVKKITKTSISLRCRYDYDTTSLPNPFCLYIYTFQTLSRIILSISNIHAVNYENNLRKKIIINRFLSLTHWHSVNFEFFKNTITRGSYVANN